MFILHGIFLLFSHQFVLLTFGIFQRRKCGTLLQLNSFELCFVPLQFLSNCFCKISELFRNIEDHSFLILILVHSSNFFIKSPGKFFSQEVPNIFKAVEFNIHIEAVSDVPRHSRMKRFGRLSSHFFKLK